MTADELRAHAKSVKLWATLGFSGEVQNKHLVPLGEIMEAAATAIESSKKEQRLPTRWAALYFGVILGYVLAWVIGGGTP